MKKIFIYLIIIILILSFFIYNSTIVNRPAISGVVIDSISQKPIQNIKVERIFLINRAGIADSVPATYSDITYTNNEGKFKFSKKNIHKGIFDRFKNDWLNVNTKQEKGQFHSYGNPADDKYYSNSTKSIFPYSFKFKEYDKNIILKLIPQVDNLDNCKGNQECIYLNSFDLAIKNNNVSFCLNLPLGDRDSRGYFTERYTCLTYFVALNKDTSLCSYFQNPSLCNQSSYKYDELSCAIFDLMPNQEKKYYLCKERLAK